MYLRGDETSISTCAFTQENAVSIEGKLTWEYVGLILIKLISRNVLAAKTFEGNRAFWGNDLPHYVLNWPIIVFNFKCLYKQVLYKYPQKDHIELVTQLVRATSSLSTQIIIPVNISVVELPCDQRFRSTARLTHHHYGWALGHLRLTRCYYYLRRHWNKNRPL